MMDLWQLPQTAVLGGKAYGIRADFRNILKIFSYLDRQELPEYVRWLIALELFYEAPIPKAQQQAAMEYLCSFIACGQTQGTHKLLDWQADSDLIVADVNKVAGCEIRALPFVHWWTFLSWFHGIGPGQLSTVVSIRDKLRRGVKLEAWERDYYRQNAVRIQMRQPLTPEEKAQKRKLEQMLK